LCAVCRKRARDRAYRAANLEKERARGRAYRAADPEKERAREHTWRAKNREKARARIRAYKTGHTRVYFAERVREQGEACAICDRLLLTERGGGNADHCHTTGLARGVLCLRCNIAVVPILENEAIALKALEYIRKWRAIHAHIAATNDRPSTEIA
jgi:hypothetical protein